MEEFLKPELAIESLDVRPGEQVADMGCGSGYFTLPLAQMVGSQGRVYALDVRPEALEATRAKSKLFHLLNIEFVQVNLERDRGSNLKDESMDKAVASNVLYQTENKEALAGEAYRILKPRGALLVVDWNESRNSGGPPLASRVGPDEAKQIFESVGFSFYKESPAGSHHYGLIFKKHP